MLIIESQYFLPIDVIKIIILRTHFKIDVYEQFKKASFRNRCMILGSNGIIPLSVPIVGGRSQKICTKDVKIDYSENWQRSHRRSLESSYNKSPFYSFYKSSIDALLSDKKKYLIDLNYSILMGLSNLLNISIEIEFTSEYIVRYDDEMDFRNKLLPKNFQADMGFNSPRYSQVFEERFGFQRNLSILDLLFCEGPNALNLLQHA